jgi:VanZ family protein
MFETRFNIKSLTTAILFMAAVLVFTHLPQETIPSPLQKDGVDKLQHVLAYGVITFLFILSLKSSPSLLSALFLFFAISAVGIVDEATQFLVNRTASVNDWLADIIGIMMALLFSKVYKRRFQKTKIA